MDFLKANEKMKEEDISIIFEANMAMENMKKWKKLEDNRHTNCTSIERGMRLKYPRLIRVSILNDSITVETELHYFRNSKWDDSKKPPTPSFKCDIQMKKLPDTAEEFMKMKKNIEDDKKTIMTAMNYLKFRYDIKK